MLNFHKLTSLSLSVSTLISSSYLSSFVEYWGIKQKSVMLQLSLCKDKLKSKSILCNLCNNYTFEDETKVLFTYHSIFKNSLQTEYSLQNNKIHLKMYFKMHMKSEEEHCIALAREMAAKSMQTVSMRKLFYMTKRTIHFVG